MDLTISRTVHITFEGRRQDVPFEQLGIDERTAASEVKAAVANFLDIPLARLNDYTVDPKDGNFVVRPEAQWG